MRRALGAAVALTLLAAFPAVAAEGPRPVFRFQDPEITESSGLVEVGRGPSARVLTVNDSGGEAVVYVVDPRSGRTVGRTTFADEATDVEAMALGRRDTVWVGDIGDNGGVRTGFTLHSMATPRDGDREAAVTSYLFAYGPGPRDAETLLVHPRTGRVSVVSKGLFGGQVWQAPRRLETRGVNVLRAVADIPGLITDGAWLPDGRHVVLRDYSRAYFFDATRDPWHLVATLRLPDQPQAEGLAVRPGGRSLLVSTEGAGEPVYDVALPPRVLRALAPEPTQSDSPDASPDSTPDLPGSGIGALVEDGALPWRLLGALTSAVLLVALGLRLRGARRRSRSRR